MVPVWLYPFAGVRSCSFHSQCAEACREDKPDERRAWYDGEQKLRENSIRNFPRTEDHLRLGRDIRAGRLHLIGCRGEADAPGKI